MIQTKFQLLIFLSILLIMLFSNSSFSQNNSCAFEQMNGAFLKENPQYKIQLDHKKVEQYFQSVQYKNTDCTEIDTYPIVFHWLYDPDNLNEGYSSDDVILNTVLSSINGFFAELPSAAFNIPPAFNGIPADGTCIEFCLASSDHPQDAAFFGNDLNRDGIKDANNDGIIDEGQFAINRYTISANQVSSIQNAFANNSQRALINSIAPAWDATEYINIYVVPLLSPRDADGEYVAGYTFTPNSGPSISNSIFMEASVVSNSFHVAHEIGHWLGLSHVWGDNEGCTDKDYWVFPGTSYPIPDTYDQSARSTTGCDATTNAGLPTSCGSYDNVFNMMDYTNCDNLHFTNDQATYMQAVDDLLSVRLNFSNNLELVKCNPIITGCTNMTACNYDPNATSDDGSCNLRDCLGNCSGNNTGPVTVGAACDDGFANTIGDAYNADCRCKGVNIGSTCQNTIEMPYAGWHLISSPCLASNDSIEAIFAPIKNDIVQVKNLNGNVYVPSFNNFNNGLDFWDINQGYMVKTIAPVTLNINGGPNVNLSNDNISINSGWNLIAYWLQGNAFPIDVFASIANNVIQVKSLNGAYIPSFNNFDSIDTMRMNNGYFVKMVSSDDLYYDPNDAFSRPAPSFNSNENDQPTPKHFTKQISPNPNNATILIMNENNPMNVGDELGVFTQDGILVASFVYQHKMMGGLVYGDDITEDGKDGLEDNEAYVFKVWDAALNQERILEMNFEKGKKTFIKDDLVAVSFKNDASTGITGINASFGVALNPNPATNEVNFTIDLKNPANVLIEIFSIDGKMIEVVSNQKLSAGTSKINHAVDHLNSGMYLYRITEGQSSFTSKFTIAR